MALRSCDVCHAADELPRHIQAVVTGDPSQEFVRHFACCAAVGCPDGSCNAIVAEASSGESGPGLQ
jgi:hypothetical protein